MSSEPQRLSDEFSYEGGLIFPMLPLLKVKLGAQYYLDKRNWGYKFFKQWYA